MAEPAADITDLYAFPSPEHPGRLVLVLNTLPFAPPTAAFCDGLIYRFRLRPLTADAREDATPFAVAGEEIVIDCVFSAPVNGHGADAAKQEGTCSVPGETVSMRVNDERGGQAHGVRVFAPAEGATIRSDLELRLLRASIAISQSSPQAPALVRQALAAAERHGFAQTVVDTAPLLVEHVISDSHLYPRTRQLTALITASLKARKRAAPAARQGKLPDPLTAGEIRVLEKLSERLTYTEIASDLYLSLNTVKTHLRHAYMKLGVTSRSSAIKRATSLGVL